MINHSASGHVYGVGDLEWTAANEAAWQAGIEIKQDRWDRVDQKAQQYVADGLRYAPDESPRARFATAVGLLELLKSKTLGTRSDQTLEQIDRDAWEALRLRKVPLEQLREKLRHDPDVANVMRRSRERALREVLRGDEQHRAFARYLVSDGFIKKLEDEGPVRGRQHLQLQLMRLSSLSPRLAEKVAAELAAKRLAADPTELLRTLPAAESQAALERSLDFLESLTRKERAKMGFNPTPPSQGPPLPKVAELHEYISTPQKRAQLARGLAAIMNSPKLGKSLRGLTDEAAFARLRVHNVEGAEFLRRYTKTPGIGRGMLGVFNLAAMFSIYKSQPFVGPNGELRWDQMATTGSAVLSVCSSAEKMAKLCDENIIPQIADYFSKEFKASSLCKGSGGTIQFMARNPTFKHLCDGLGFIGDAITLPFAIKAIQDERADEDAIGLATAYVGLAATGGSIAFGLASAFGFTVCPPVALTVAFIGIAASFVNTRFGQSALTGDVMRRLRETGIIELEQGCYEDCATETYQKSQTAGYFGTGRRYTTTERREVSYNRYEANVRGLSLDRQLHLINHFIHPKTKGPQETQVLEIFEEARRDPAGFVRLIEATDARRLANEIEDASEAAKLMDWTLAAYRGAGKKPGRGFTAQLECHCDEHDWQTLVEFFRRIGRKHPDDKAAFYAVDPGVLNNAVRRLSVRKLGDGGEMAIQHLFATVSNKQLDAMVERGRGALVKRVFGQLDGDLRDAFRDRLQSSGLSATTQSYATMYP